MKKEWERGGLNALREDSVHKRRISRIQGGLNIYREVFILIGRCLLSRLHILCAHLWVSPE